MKANPVFFIPHVLIVALVLWALVPTNPYSYYIVMRWIVSISFVFLAFRSFESRQAFAWAWLVAAGIYNPIIPVHATREFWSGVNIATVLLVIFGAAATRKTIDS